MCTIHKFTSNYLFDVFGLHQGEWMFFCKVYRFTSTWYTGHKHSDSMGLTLFMSAFASIGTMSELKRESCQFKSNWYTVQEVLFYVLCLVVDVLWRESCCILCICIVWCRKITEDTQNMASNRKLSRIENSKMENEKRKWRRNVQKEVCWNLDK